jgi:hypothetical protein
LDTEIRIDNPPDEILPGYSFTGEISGGEEEHILTIEAAAIAYENGRAYAEKVPGAERVAVEVIPYGRNMVKILSGLEPGDQVKGQAAVQGFSSIRQGRGMSVRVGR